MRKVAFGPIAEVYTHELLQKTYGGKLTVLSEMATETAKILRLKIVSKSYGSKVFS